MNRYSEIKTKFPREIVLLKGSPCKWGRCTFCDYIHDNSEDQEENNKVNMEVLKNVTGKYGVLEVINSGNVFELPEKTILKIKAIIKTYNIRKVFFEAHWIYKDRLQEIRDFFGVPIVFKTGLETFDEDFREGVLKKGFGYKNIEELRSYFDSVCLMVGIQGQTKEGIRNDIKTALDNFEHFTVNVYVENSTNIKPDIDLIRWFRKEFSFLEKESSCEVLWNNTDFGVG